MQPHQDTFDKILAQNTNSTRMKELKKYAAENDDKDAKNILSSALKKISEQQSKKQTAPKEE